MSALLLPGSDWLSAIAERATPPALRAVPDLADPITLRDFIYEAWHVVEPNAPMSSNWHIDAIAEHLEAVTRGEIRNLLINMPPRHMKSLCVSVFWPVWSWLQEPWTRWLTSSYAASLATRDSLKSRRLIESDWFRRRYMGVFKLTSDQNQKTRYDNDRSGYRIATSVGGSATGEGGDIIVVDDPHKASEASSEKLRTNVIEWWDETMSSRLNDPRTGRKVIVMQRVHEADLSGHVLEQGGYDHLVLPAEYEPERKVVTTIGWSDPRQQDGELLWPHRVGTEQLDELKAAMGSYGYAGQYQQRPVPRGGGMFKTDWWRRYEPGTLPPLRRLILTCDTAYKEGAHNDFSVIAAWGEGTDGYYYVVDVWRERAEMGKLLRAAHMMYHRHRPLSPLGWELVVEDKGSGIALLQTMSKPYYLPPVPGEPLDVDANGRPILHPAITVSPFPRSSSPLERELAALPKVSRAEAVINVVEAGRVAIPTYAPWLEAWLREHEQFPNGQHDDTVDTTSMGLIRLHAAPRPLQRQRAAPTTGYTTYG